MTPEERFTRIENALGAMAERQAAHDVQLEKTVAHIRQNAEQIEKNTAGIRDLIVVSRTVIDHQQVIDGKLNALIDTVDRMGSTVERLGAKIDNLIDTVEAFLKGFQKPNGQH